MALPRNSNLFKRKPVGDPLPRSDEQIAELSAVTPEDILAAQATVAGTPLGALLDAELVGDDEPITS